MSLKEFAKDITTQGEVIKTILISLVTSFGFLIILYLLKLRLIENFIPKYGFFLFFAILSYALILPSIRQVRTYKQFPCMSGMMIGMTIGMIAGFLSGFYIGATNGMFIGTVFGMAIGIGLGAYNGKCCGIMGLMEGIMAGFMGGIMGAMTAVMLINEYLKLASVIMFLVSAVIMVGLKYMIFKETREFQKNGREDQFFTIFCSLLLTTLTVWIMVFGPRSLLFQ